MKALVLSGGGAKGSYQIGAWKALKKLHIKFDIVTGTSIGALNGAMVTQNSYRRAISLWKKINLEVLFNETVDNSNDLEVMKLYGKTFLKQGGMEVTEIEKIIKKELNYKKFYNSKINYGLVTLNLTTKKPVEISKKDIPKEKLADYLMASASCYPAFKQKEIDGNKYIDGGVIDNLPINLAIDLGADEIIAIDLSAPGITKKPKKNVKITKVRPNNKLTNFLNFYEEGAKRNIKLGYNDTLKKFGKLEGKKYTFRLGTIKKNQKKHLTTFQYILEDILDSKKATETFKNLLHISKVETEEIANKMTLKVMEAVAKDLKLDETKIYTERHFNKELKKNLKTLTSKEVDNIKEMIEEIKDHKKSLKKKALLSPWLFLKALYLYTICEV